MTKNYVVLSRIIWLSLIFFIIGCAGFKKVERKTIPNKSFQKFSEQQLNLIRSESPFLKVHMRSGNLYVLKDWQTDNMHQTVVGTGRLFNPARKLLREGQFQIGLDSVAIFETNTLKSSGALNALAIITGVSAALTAACIANPKACFGSCPTFYVRDGDTLHLRAEGFSSSIAPSLEATDLDALRFTAGAGERVDVEMRNEALETHVVRMVNLRIVPKPRNAHIFATPDGSFRQVDTLLSPLTATADEGDIRPLLLNLDNRERFSKADSSYLGSKEIIELKFENIPDRPCGLVLACRQTLLSTYLLYQTYAYMGNQVGDWFARIERGKLGRKETSLEQLMGGIEILLKDGEGNWQKIDQVYEYGPLATDVHFVPLKHLPGGSASIRLRMAKGNWRIDYAALGVVAGASVPATRLLPQQVLKDGVEDPRALERLHQPNEMLVTLPGDRYTLTYKLPPSGSGEYAVFLESRGYYLEWIRTEWLKEENPLRLAEMFLNPRSALKRLAPEYKRKEAQMEYYFWRSRYARP